MPFIKVQLIDGMDQELYVNSDAVHTVQLINSVGILNFDQELFFRYQKFDSGVCHYINITEESARYFLSELDTRDSQVNASDIPERSLTSRIASALRDNFPTGASFRDLFAQFPEDKELTISNAIADLRREKVIDVLEDGTVIHKSNAIRDESLVAPAICGPIDHPLGTLYCELEAGHSGGHTGSITPSPDLLTEDADNDSDLPDDTTRS